VAVAVPVKRKRAAVATTADAATATATATESQLAREGQQVQLCEAAVATGTSSKRCRVTPELTEHAIGGAPLLAVAQGSHTAAHSVLQRSVEMCKQQ
jgi:hypothetical protein